MKKKYSPLAITLFLTFVFFSHLTTFAQDKISGNGNVTTKVHDVGSFNALELGGVFNIILHQGSKEEVKVIADENLHDLITIEKRGNRLEIETKPRIHIRKKNKMEVHVTVKNLSRMKLGGIGNVETDGTLQLDDLDLEISCVGNVELKLECNNLVADLHSVGNISLSGKIKKADIENNSVGKLAAYDMKTEIMALHVRGVGGTEVYVEKEFSIKTTGVGNVNYKGDAVITNMHISGVGKVRKRD